MSRICPQDSGLRGAPVGSPGRHFCLAHSGNYRTWEWTSVVFDLTDYELEVGAMFLQEGQ